MSVNDLLDSEVFIPAMLVVFVVVMINMVVFELANGSRVELAIKDPNTYGIMVEGDRGTLKYQGKKFVGFERGSNNET